MGCAIRSAESAKAWLTTANSSAPISASIAKPDSMTNPLIIPGNTPESKLGVTHKPSIRKTKFEIAPSQTFPNYRAEGAASQVFSAI